MSQDASNSDTVAKRLLSTGEAAQMLGISSRTLARWWKEGFVTPEFVTLGGQGRWDLDDLRAQIKAIQDSDEWTER